MNKYTTIFNILLNVLYNGYVPSKANYVTKTLVTREDFFKLISVKSFV